MDPDSGTNLAVLYATLIIIIGTVLTEWPPQDYNAVLYIGFGLGGLIFIRILHLIWQLDPLINRAKNKFSGWLD